MGASSSPGCSLLMQLEEPQGMAPVVGALPPKWESQMQLPGSWLQPVSALATVGTGAVTQQTEELYFYLLFSVYNSDFK